VLLKKLIDFIHPFESCKISTFSDDEIWLFLHFSAILPLYITTNTLPQLHNLLTMSLSKGWNGFWQYFTLFEYRPVNRYNVGFTIVWRSFEDWIAYLPHLVMLIPNSVYQCILVFFLYALPPLVRQINVVFLMPWCEGELNGYSVLFVDQCYGSVFL